MAFIDDFMTEVATAMGQISGINASLDYEPEQLPTAPMVTQMYVDIEPEDVETGPGQDVTHIIRLRLYLKLQNYKTAQEQLRRLIPEVVDVIRANPRIGGAIRATITGQDEPSFDHETGLLFKSFRLTALTTQP